MSGAVNVRRYSTHFYRHFPPCIDVSRLVSSMANGDAVVGVTAFYTLTQSNGKLGSKYMHGVCHMDRCM
uniref:Expressed protein n=1 Tax=Echinococcus granulosus TaxID=6210 RepID=A0A068WAG3_ECHGR|nr:expressed protein [Echinococcus granulosus]